MEGSASSRLKLKRLPSLEDPSALDSVSEDGDRDLDASVEPLNPSIPSTRPPHRLIRLHLHQLTRSNALPRTQGTGIYAS